MTTIRTGQAPEPLTREEFHKRFILRYYDPAFVGVETGPDYVPVTAAVVRFSRNRVTAWERLR